MLKMCTSRIPNGHFDSRQLLKTADFKQFDDNHMARILEAGSSILRHLQSLISGIPRNEAEVRYAVWNEVIYVMYIIRR